MDRLSSGAYLEAQSALKFIYQDAALYELYFGRTFIALTLLVGYLKFSKQEIILKHNISQIVSKINLIENSQLTHDSTIIITNNMKIDEDFVIDKNIALTINPGVTITLLKNANIYVYGKIISLGNFSNPIKFVGNENSNSAIYINSLTEIKLQLL